MASYNMPRYSMPAKTGIETVTAYFGELVVATALATNDTINCCKIPIGATILGAEIHSNGTQGANTDSTFKLGDATDDDRFITTAGGIILRQNGGVARINAVPTATTGMGYVYTADTDLIITIAAQGTGQTTGGYIRGWVTYLMP